ncbi:hypothetical protein [Dyadobacter sp. CY356]|uniref:hypothetical protein n=1 Tax=Dyadobacter sp. CY356 TaxID=2906442 RepID=UPI001F41F311|nr:hypothetical protein [Dyadobacter sp. CY356]
MSTSSIIFPPLLGISSMAILISSNTIDIANPTSVLIFLAVTQVPLTSPAPSSGATRFFHLK